MLVLASALTSVYASGTCTRLSTLEPRSQLVDTILNISTYFTYQTKELKLCGSQCLREKKCKSVNFEEKTGICELNEASLETVSSGYLHPVIGAVHMSTDDLEYLTVCHHFNLDYFINVWNNQKMVSDKQLAQLLLFRLRRVYHVITELKPEPHIHY